MDVINHQTFDWIFFAIVGLPLVVAVIELAKPDWLERWIREKPDATGRDRTRSLGPGPRGPRQDPSASRWGGQIR